MNIERDQYKTLANLIEAWVHKDGQQDLFAEDPKLKALAQHYAELIVRKRVRESATQTGRSAEVTSPKAYYEKVEVHSTTSSHGKAVGCEHIALEQL